LYILEQLQNMGQNITMEHFQLWIDLYENQVSQISFYKRMRLSPYYFNPIFFFWFPMIFFNVQNQLF
jgi:hypothetical protein